MLLFRAISPIAIAIGSLISAGASSALADTFHITYLGPGVQVSSDSTYVETFNSFNGSTTTFNGSGITGTYTGSFTISDPNLFGGADGTGKFITTNSTATLTPRIASPGNVTQTATMQRYLIVLALRLPRHPKQYRRHREVKPRS